MVTGQARLIQTWFIKNSTLLEVSVKCFPIISCLKCTVNLKILSDKLLQINFCLTCITGIVVFGKIAKGEWSLSLTRS